MAIAALLWLALLWACQRATPAPAVDIAGEDFGTGIHLLMDEAEARRAAAAASTIAVQVVTPEELLNANPFGRSNTAQDLVLAVVRPLPGNPVQKVLELRCYAAGAGSKLTLQGQPFTSLALDQADSLLRQKGSRIATETETHVDYVFESKGSEVSKLLTLSLRSATGCYAAKLQVASPKELGR